MMWSPVPRLGFIVAVFSLTSALDIPLGIPPTNGLQVTVSPDKGSLGVARRLPPDSGRTPLPPPPSQAPGNDSNPPPPGSSSVPPPSNPPPSSVSPLQFTGRIDFSLASIRELDNNGTMVTTISPRMFNSFSNLNTGAAGGGGGGNGIAPPYDTPLPSSNPAMTVNCQYAINSPLQPVLNATTFSMSACVMTMNATLSYGNEVNQIIAGQLGVSLMISSWPWTSSGAYLEFNVTVAVPIGRQLSPAPPTSSAKKIMLGTNDSYVLFSAKATNQMTSPTPDSYMTMPQSYPMLVQNGPVNNVATIVLMLPRTSTPSIAWNAIIEPGYGSQYKPAPVGTASLATMPSWMIQVAAAVLVGCFIGRH